MRGQEACARKLRAQAQHAQHNTFDRSLRDGAKRNRPSPQPHFTVLEANAMLDPTLAEGKEEEERKDRRGREDDEDGRKRGVQEDDESDTERKKGGGNE